MNDEQEQLWAAYQKAWQAAHNHQWREPWASRFRAAQEAAASVLTPADRLSSPPRTERDDTAAEQRR